MIMALPSLLGGGAQRVALELAPALGERYEVTLALLEERRELSAPEGIETVAFSPPASSAAGHILLAFSHVSALAKLTRQKGCRTVLSFMEQANVVAALAQRRGGFRAILTQHVSPDSQYEKKGLLGKLILGAARFSYPKAAGVVCVSEAVGKAVEAAYGVPGEKLGVIHNPIDQRRFNEAAAPVDGLAKPYILCAGRIHFGSKGQDLLLEAYAKLKPGRTKLVFVGDGPDKESLRKRAATLGLGEEVVFTGWRDDVESYMAHAELLALPSRFEGFGLVLAEAMACGCPVVAFDCPGGAGEVLLGGEAGALVPPEDTGALAEAIGELLASPARSQELKRKGLERAKDFTLESIGGKYLDTLERLGG